MSGRDSRTEFMEYEFCSAVRVLSKSKKCRAESMSEKWFDERRAKIRMKINEECRGK